MDREHFCAFCEYFDGGGEKHVLAARAGERIAGDCLNNRSPYFTVWGDQGCPEFFADTTAERE